MVNSVHSSGAAAQVQQAQARQTQQAKQAPPPKQAEKQDTVVLSKQATGDVDHDGDSH
jgi:hypothetical protein